MNPKVIGSLLLFAGVLLICVSGYSVYRCFTGQDQPADLFSGSGISLDLNRLLGQSLNPAPTHTDVKDTGRVELLSAENSNRMFNLTFHLMMMGFVSSVGFHLASLGNQLLRPIDVHLKSSGAKDGPTPTSTQAG